MKNYPSILLVLLFLFSGHSKALEKAANLHNGSMSIDLRWESNDTGGDALFSKIAFLPNKNAPTCERLSFIQTARVKVEGNKNIEWSEFSGQANRNKIRTISNGSTIEDGYFIDHDASLCKQGKNCSPFYRDSWENSDESSDGESSSVAKKVATMLDAPYGWESFESIELEACAICANENNYQVLACVEWGGEWPSIGDRKIHSIEFSEKETATFQNALKIFLDFYKS